LSDKEPGEKVIRPSSRGPSFLTLTLKIFDGVYVHKEIAESGKDRKDITSFLRLGKTLTIDGENFEDLDEVGAYLSAERLPQKKQLILLYSSISIIIFSDN
jgi:transcription elongation factor SPT6